MHFFNNPPTRPLVITIISIWGLIASLLGILGFFSATARISFIQQFGEPFIYFYIPLSIALLISYIGIWKMKKWSVYLYSIIMIINFSIGFYFKIPGILSYLIPLIFSIILFNYIKKME